MALITCQFVRPDRMLFEGQAEHVVLVTRDGELGVWPGHAPEVCALGDGVVRIARPKTDGARLDIVVSGGYAEIANDVVIILANHARSIDDIDPDTVRSTRQDCIDILDGMEAGDHRHAYYENKIKWCNLLLRQAQANAQAGTK